MKEKKISNTVKTFVTLEQYAKIDEGEKLSSAMTVSEEKTYRGTQGYWITLEFAGDADKAHNLITEEFNSLTDEQISAYALEQFYIRFQDKKRIELQSQLGIIEGGSLLSRDAQRKIKDLLMKATAEERTEAGDNPQKLYELMVKYSN